MLSNKQKAMLTNKQEQTKMAHVGCGNMRVVEIEWGFADDLIIHIKSEKDFQTNLNVWKTVLQKGNIKKNIHKAKVMEIGKKHVNVEIKLNKKKLEQIIYPLEKWRKTS